MYTVVVVIVSDIAGVINKNPWRRRQRFRPCYRSRSVCGWSIARKIYCALDDVRVIDRGKISQFVLVVLKIWNDAKPTRTFEFLFIRLFYGDNFYEVLATTSSKYARLFWSLRRPFSGNKLPVAENASLMSSEPVIVIGAQSLNDHIPRICYVYISAFSRILFSLPRWSPFSWYLYNFHSNRK